MTIKGGKLRCDMSKDCAQAVTHIDEKGFAYCAAHGAERKAYRHCRALRPYELRRLEAGKTIDYELKTARFYASEDRRLAEDRQAAAVARASGKRVRAKFHPQAWINDYAVDVDPEGPLTWDVTDAILAMGKTRALELQDSDYATDVFRDASGAPEWVREWSGPFYVEVEGSIREFFGMAEGASEAAAS